MPEPSQSSRSRTASPTSAVSRCGASTLTAKVVSKPSPVIRGVSPRTQTPALCASTSTPPASRSCPRERPHRRRGTRGRRPRGRRPPAGRRRPRRPRSSLRACTRTRWPCSSRRRAAARPMPSVEPVTQIVDMPEPYPGRRGGRGQAGWRHEQRLLRHHRPRRRPQRRRPDGPREHAGRHVPGLDQAHRQQPEGQAAAAARRPGRDPRVLRGVRQLPAGRRGRVLLLRPARLGLQRPAGRPVAVGDRPVRRRGRAGPGRARADRRRLLPARAVLGRRPGPRVRPRAPGAPQGPGRLQHDGEHPGLQRLRRGGADAADGPGGAGRDQGDGGRGPDLRARATTSC